MLVKFQSPEFNFLHAAPYVKIIDVYGVTTQDSQMIFMGDSVTPENHWRIASIVYKSLSW